MQRTPMTPEQLDSYRPKPVAANQPAETAKHFAHRTAVPLEVVLRIEELERKVLFLIEALGYPLPPKV